MEFEVNEAGCKVLSSNMVSELNEIFGLVSEIDNQNGTLKAALGDDYYAIAKTVRVMVGELSNAGRELKTIINDMNEYMQQVHKARVTLN